MGFGGYLTWTAVAREIYKNPYLYDSQIKSSRERQANLREALAIINESISSSIRSLLPIGDILTQYLEEENDDDDGEDDKRESKTATEYEKIVQNAYEKYELEKLKQTEILKTIPPSLNKYYQERVNRYFNLLLQ